MTRLHAYDKTSTEGPAAKIYQLDGLEYLQTVRAAEGR